MRRGLAGSVGAGLMRPYLKNIVNWILFCLPFLFMQSAFAYGNSNLDVFGYPKPECTKPIKPSEPFGRDSFSVEMYNLDVEAYNADLEQYITCVKEYVNAAKDDIDLISESIKSAISDANSPW